MPAWAPDSSRPGWSWPANAASWCGSGPAASAGGSAVGCSNDPEAVGLDAESNAPPAGCCVGTGSFGKCPAGAEPGPGSVGQPCRPVKVLGGFGSWPDVSPPTVVGVTPRLVASGGDAA